MGSEGSIGSIRSAGSGQSTEGTNGQSTSILIENARVGTNPCSPVLPQAGDGVHPLPWPLLAKKELLESSILY